MGREEIFEKVKDFLVDIIGLDDDSDIKEESNIAEDLGADSLDFVELIMKLENIFDIKIEDEDVETIYTVEDLINYIDSKINKL